MVEKIKLSWMNKLRHLQSMYQPEVAIGKLYKYGKEEEERLTNEFRTRIKKRRV